MFRNLLEVRRVCGGIALAGKCDSGRGYGFNTRGRPSLKPTFLLRPDGKGLQPRFSAAAPLATLAKARDMVRRKVAAGLTGDVLVLIHGGTYQLTNTLVFGPDDSGTEKYPITYAAYPGEKVVLSGGRRITGMEERPQATFGRRRYRRSRSATGTSANCSSTARAPSAPECPTSTDPNTNTLVAYSNLFGQNRHHFRPKMYRSA